MSASKKKQLRKEQQMTERQNEAAKEAKKLKRYTLAFWVAMALVLCVFIGAIASTPIKNVVYRNTDSIKIGNHTLSSTEANYFYVDAVTQYTNQNYQYIQYGLINIDLYTPLNKQPIAKDSDVTWGQNFLDMTSENIKSIYALYDEAVKNNYQLTEDEQKTIDTMMANMDFYAKYNGFANTDAYLRAIYGNGATKESYREYYTISTIARSYYNAYADALQYDAEALRAYEKDTFYQYNSYSFASFYVDAAKFLPTDAPKGEDGKPVYTDEMKAAAVKAAEEVANALAAGSYADREAFDAAIKALEMNADNQDVESTKYDDVLYSKVTTIFQDWITGKVPSEDEDAEPVYETRTEGEMKVIAKESGTDDKKTTDGYYVLRYESVNTNEFAMKDVCHLLVPFENGTTNQTTGVTTYSDESKAMAKSKADALLKQWKDAGDLTEESFIKFAEKNTADSGVKYENVYPNQMVEPFEDWCYDVKRLPGDVDIVETEYGYHIMYFVGHTETNYRDFMITNDMRSEDLTEWHDGLLEAIKPLYVILTDKHIMTDMLLSSVMGH